MVTVPLVLPSSPTYVLPSPASKTSMPMPVPGVKLRVTAVAPHVSVGLPGMLPTTTAVTVDDEIDSVVTIGGVDAEACELP
jgi:hypothetical protein